MAELPPSAMRTLMRELKQLATSPPAGVRFLPRDDDVYLEVHAELEGPTETPFAGGRFAVKLVLDSSYPASPPRGFFLTKIFHPNVSPAGEICVNALKKDWEPGMGLAHLLKVIWCLMLVPFPESALNDDAGRLFMESYGEYFKKASMMTQIYAIENRPGASTPSSSSSSSSSASPTASSPSSPLLLSSSSSLSSGASQGAADELPIRTDALPKSLKSKSPNRPPQEAPVGAKKRPADGGAGGAGIGACTGGGGGGGSGSTGINNGSTNHINTRNGSGGAKKKMRVKGDSVAAGDLSPDGGKAVENRSSLAANAGGGSGGGGSSGAASPAGGVVMKELLLSTVHGSKKSTTQRRRNSLQRL